MILTKTLSLEMEDFDESIGSGKPWDEDKMKRVSEFIKERAKKQSFKRKMRNRYLGWKYRWQDRIETFYEKLNKTNMKHALIIGLLAILVLAIILGLQAFAWVFTTIIHYGVIALVFAAAIYFWWKIRKKFKKDENPKQ